MFKPLLSLLLYLLGLWARRWGCLPLQNCPYLCFSLKTYVCPCVTLLSTHSASESVEHSGHVPAPNHSSQCSPSRKYLVTIGNEHDDTCNHFHRWPAQNSLWFTYLFSGTHLTSVVDLNTGSLKMKWELGAKTATTLQFMNTRDQICVGYHDGSVTIFNLRGESIITCEAPPSVNEPIISITFREFKNLLVAATPSCVIQWILTEKEVKHPSWVYVH